MPIRESMPYGDVLRAVLPAITLAPLQWRPPCDVCETASAFTVALELAGMDEQDIEVELYQDALVVQGERRVDVAGGAAVYRAAEIRQGPFRVEVTLPGGIDTDRVQATYDRGLLRIELPKAPRGRAFSAEGDVPTDGRPGSR